MRARSLLGGLVLLTALLGSSTVGAPTNAAFRSMERKLNHLKTNAATARPDQSPTEFSEAEINAYFASGGVKLPLGVESVSFQAQPGIVAATARVDFDQLKAGRSSINPLLELFSGVHDVVGVAHAFAAGGQGVVHVDSVALDGVVVPQFLLQLFVEKFIQPKYPDIGLDSRFALPERIDTATVGLHKLTVTQK